MLGIFISLRSDTSFEFAKRNEAMEGAEMDLSDDHGSVCPTQLVHSSKVCVFPMSPTA